MEEKLNIIYCETGKLSMVDTVEDKLEELQEKVDGLIEIMELEQDVCLICNEEGKINGLPLNRAIRDENGEIVEVVAGNFIIVGQDKDTGNLKSLDENQLKKYMEIFKYPEEIMLINGQIFAEKFEPKPTKNRSFER